MNYTKKERDNYSKDRAYKCFELKISKNQYNAFRRLGIKLHKIYENNCNGLYEDEVAYCAVTQPIVKKIEELSKALGLYYYLQTDPRGAALYLNTRQISQNSYTNAVCIY